MLVAKIIGGQVVDIADYRAMFISNVFPPEGPSDTWMLEQGVKRVNVYREHDLETEKLVPCAPVIEGDWVYTVEVQPLSAEDIEARTSTRKLDNAARARQLLQETDWCDLLSVRNTAVNPHLTNTAEFDTYRLALRQIAINPPELVETWPTRPDASWSSGT